MFDFYEKNCYKRKLLSQQPGMATNHVAVKGAENVGSNPIWDGSSEDENIGVW